MGRMGKINIGVLAYVDAGKTTTVERMLHLSGAIKQPGSVDAGNTQTDWLAIERARGISVRSSSIGLRYGGAEINIVDTPGHMDFTGEVERALLALDAVVLVVSAAEGVQSQTELFWRAIREMRLPCFLFVNKVDRSGCDAAGVDGEIRRILSPDVVALNEVDRAGEAGCTARHRPLSELSEDETLAVCERNEGLATRFLDGEAVPEAEIEAELWRRVREGTLFPLLFGAAARGVGVDGLLDAIARCFCSRGDAEKETDEPSGVIYKIEHDDKMGKVAHVRLFAGSIKNRGVVSVRPLGKKDESEEEDTQAIREKITQIRAVSGGRKSDAGVAHAGDIVAVYGLERARAGYVVGDPAKLPGRLLALAERRLAPPLLSVKVSAPEGKQSELLEATTKLADEDPLLDCQWNPDERELSIRIMGPIQIEVLSYLIRERYGLDVAFSKPVVIYKETPLASGVGYEEYTMPKPCWAIVKLQIDPLPRGAGYAFESRVRDDRILYRYQHHIATAVPETLKQGLMGWEVTDLKVTLIDGEHHAQHTHNMDFFLATPIAVMDGLRNCGTGLLEPILKMRLSASEELGGRLIGDVLAMRGEAGNPVISGGEVHIEALVPVATSMDYPVTFASLTSGRGKIKTEFYGYKECPVELGATTERRGVNPLDRAKWILAKRGAV